MALLMIAGRKAGVEKGESTHTLVLMVFSIPQSEQNSVITSE